MFGGLSITEAPLAHARAVRKPAIAEVIDLDTGEILTASDYVTAFLYQDLVTERGRILTRMTRGEPRFLCDMCHIPVYLVSRPEEHIFYFRHKHEDGSCPAQTRSPLTMEEILARKYHGLRESEPHKLLKALLLRSLSADPAFTNIASEKNWKSAANAREFRRPDVQAEEANGRVAFEVQLSTTFLSVVIGRREFYRAEGALLVWLFGGFDPSYRLMTTDDLLFPNNSNLFVVDAETTEISEERQSLHLRCHFRKPHREGNIVADSWHEEIVAFAALTQDRDGQRAWYFDYEAAEMLIRAEIEAEANARRESAARKQAEVDEIERRDFFEFWISHTPGFLAQPDERWIWWRFQTRFARRGIKLPDHPDGDGEFRSMLGAIYSAREGKPVGWKFKKLVQIGHLLANNHPRLLLVFGYALEEYGRKAQLRREDSKGRWATRSAAMAERLRRHDPELCPDAELLPLMAFLFPEIAQRTRGYRERANSRSRHP